ncbi:MAG: ribonuclease HII, partial [Clostridia bacterium]|nr:ribonuclease HII [Clostridia bacterium]
MSRNLKPSAKRLERFLEKVDFDRRFAGFGASLAGMDEAGRGPLLGPVVAACVILPESPLLTWVDDSKKLSAARRETVFDQIMNTAVHVSVGQASAKEIDELNILNATKLAMRRAGVCAPAILCLVDAVGDIGLPFSIHSEIHGDARSYHIAAASVIAKVTRDRMLREMDRIYPDYGFARNMGDGNAAQIAAIRRAGAPPEHRRAVISEFPQETES